jgi:pilus assembly protein CpaB
MSSFLRVTALSIGLAVLSAALLFLYVRNVEIETSGGALVDVLTVNAQVERGVALEESALSVRAIPQAFVERRMVRASDKAKILGLKTEAALSPQQTLLWSDLAIASDDKRTLSNLVRPGMRAFGMRATADERQYALYRPGDRVDILVTLPATGPSDDKQATSRVLVQNVLVLAVGTELSSSTTRAPGEGQRDLVLTLSVSPLQAQHLTLAQDKGKLSAALRHPEDNRTIEGPLALSGATLFGEPKRPAFSAGPSGPTRLEGK